MPAAEPTVELDERFSSEGATPPAWPDVVEVLERSEMFWLSTVRADGRPHVAPLPAMWLDGDLHFCTGPDEQKARNLAVEPRCVLTTGGNAFRSGLDVVVEGRAERVTAEGLLTRLRARWEAKLGWCYDVVDGGFREASGPEGTGSKGEDVVHVFALAPAKVLAFGRGQVFSQTRYRFDRP
jgi:general stress protein 26